ncbi:MAG TPA: SRPBCC domain-containing protein [Rhizomicrobium sp.]|nr:SRPBCC domain-containing protein [Rhizomicrobium sp.]
MAEAIVIHDTFVIRKSYPVPVSRVFSFLSEPAKKARWYAADSETSTADGMEMDFREGGIERAHYRLNERTPFPGAVLATEGIYQDIQQNRRIVLASSMTLAGRRISCSLVTFELLEGRDATDLLLTHQGAFFEGSGGPEMRKAGWETLLDRLGQSLSD